MMNQYDLSINRVKLWLLLSHKTKLLTLPVNFATRKYLYKFFFFRGEEELFTRVPEIIWHEEIFWKVIRVDAKNQLTIGANRRASRKKKKKRKYAFVQTQTTGFAAAQRTHRQKTAEIQSTDDSDGN